MNIAVTDYRQLNEDYLRIEQAILYLEKNAQHQPELEEVAKSVGLSEFHFQRLFTRWAGISPKRFLQFVTRENAKDLLDLIPLDLDRLNQLFLTAIQTGQKFGMISLDQSLKDLVSRNIVDKEQCLYLATNPNVLNS